MAFSGILVIVLLFFVDTRSFGGLLTMVILHTKRYQNIIDEDHTESE